MSSPETAEANGVASGVDWQSYEAKCGRAANNLTCQQYGPKFRGESRTTGRSLLTLTEVSLSNGIRAPGGATNPIFHLADWDGTKT